MTIDLMVDIETLDTENSAIVTQVAMVAFDPESYQVQRCNHWILDVSDQMLHQRTLSVDTLSWWLDQSKRAQESLKEALVGENHNLAQFDRSFLEAFNYEDTNFGVGNVWMQGPTFDNEILDDLLSEGVPWRFWQVADIRTVEKLASSLGVPIHDFKEVLRTDRVAHNAIDDCMMQIQVLQEVKSWLQLREK